MTSAIDNIISPFFNNIEAMLHLAAKDEKSTYVAPALKNLSSVAIPIIREIIAPAAFRNLDPEVADIEIGDERVIRAVANKFKFGERSRGLQVLRLFNAGGTQAQNRTIMMPKGPMTYDMNTIVFGDSSNRGKFVLPVKAAAQYSDALSLSPYAESVDETFHNRSNEEGTLWDPVNEKNSNNLFDRHFVKPGVKLLQIITFNGKTAPLAALHHLLLSLGLAGSYGGQTSIYGVNVRNHVVGIFAGKFEQPVASPYETIRLLGGAKNIAERSVSEHISAISAEFSSAYPIAIDHTQVSASIKSLMEKVEAHDGALQSTYQSDHKRVVEFFNNWFSGT